MKILVIEQIFGKVKDTQSATLSKNELYHRCFMLANPESKKISKKYQFGNLYVVLIRYIALHFQPFLLVPLTDRWSNFNENKDELFD